LASPGRGGLAVATVTRNPSRPHEPAADPPGPAQGDADPSLLCGRSPVC